jgi:hypothetical protein
LPKQEQSVLSRVIQTNKTGTERNRLAKSIVVAIRNLMSQSELNQESLDLAAYIVLALQAIDETIESSVIAWEKRGYWVKADRFRMEWIWAKKYGEELKGALLNQEWETIPDILVKISAKLSNIKVSPRHRLGSPWVGAWTRFKEEFA